MPRKPTNNKDPYDTLATAARINANLTPADKQRMAQLQNWFTNVKPQIDRRADKNKKQY